MTTIEDRFGPELAGQFKEAALRGLNSIQWNKYPKRRLHRRLNELGYPPDEIKRAKVAWDRFQVHMRHPSRNGHMTPADWAVLSVALISIGANVRYSPSWETWRVP